MARSFVPLAESLLQAFRNEDYRRETLEQIVPDLGLLRGVGALALMLSTPQNSRDPRSTNQILNAAFRTLHGMGDEAYGSLLRDEMTPRSFAAFLFRTSQCRPAVYTDVFEYLRPREFMRWGKNMLHDCWSASLPMPLLGHRGQVMRRLSSLLARDVDSPPSRRRATWALLVGSLLCLSCSVEPWKRLFWWRSSEATTQEPPVKSALVPTASEPPWPLIEPVRHVLLITVDAFRADQPWTGYALAKTPYLSAFAERSVVFTQAYSVANLTTASLAGMLSGRYPSELPRDRCALGRYTFHNGLASLLAADGVHTVGVHGHAIFASSIAPSDGFREWQLIANASSVRITQGSVTGGAITALVLQTLRRASTDDQRLFLWTHLVDPHDAYVLHKDFPPSAHPLRGRYDGEIAYTDALIGEILDALAQSPYAKKTAVVITGDHGEAFLEHDNVRHGFSLYQEEIRVPLLFFVPGVRPQRIHEARSTIDLAPTIADLMAVASSPGWRGTSLVKDWATEHEPEPRAVLVDCPELGERSAMRAVIQGSTKTTFQGSATRMFDLANDPREMAPTLVRKPASETARALEVINQLSLVESSACYDE